MKVPVWIKPAAWGAVFGAVAIMITGFSWMGWTLNATHQRVATERSESAVTAALTPFCIASYLKQPDAAKKLALLREDSSSYSQRETIEKGGFATMPGNAGPTSGVADACATGLLKTKSVSLVK